jgi:hypothetical protein
VNDNRKKKLVHIVERVARLNADIKAARFEQKELCDSAWEQCEVKPKVIKQLARESAWNEVERHAQKQHEEAMDECRLALGLLADTPLGQAELQRTEAQEPQHHLTNPKYKARRNKKPAGDELSA